MESMAHLVNDLVESRKLINDTISYNFVSNVRECGFVCDISQINRLVVNLLLNSEEAFPESQKDRMINVSVVCDDNKVKITFEDNGPGFKEDLLNSAKEAYVTTKIDGTGLGLAIVDRIVVDHGGILNINNSNAGGASVELIFNTKELNFKLK